MDQDFHYYGTFHSAMCAGFDNADATLIAKASNFIDFFHEGEYNADWSLVSDDKEVRALHNHCQDGQASLHLPTRILGYLQTS